MVSWDNVVISLQARTGYLLDIARSATLIKKVLNLILLAFALLLLHLARDIHVRGGQGSWDNVILTLQAQSGFKMENAKTAYLQKELKKKYFLATVGPIQISAPKNA